MHAEVAAAAAEQRAVQTGGWMEAVESGMQAPLARVAADLELNKLDHRQMPLTWHLLPEPCVVRLLQPASCALRDRLASSTLVLQQDMFAPAAAAAGLDGSAGEATAAVVPGPVFRRLLPLLQPDVEGLLGSLEAVLEACAGERRPRAWALQCCRAGAAAAAASLLPCLLSRTLRHLVLMQPTWTRLRPAPAWSRCARLWARRRQRQKRLACTSTGGIARSRRRRCRLLEATLAATLPARPGCTPCCAPWTRRVLVEGCSGLGFKRCAGLPCLTLLPVHRAPSSTAGRGGCPPAAAGAGAGPRQPVVVAAGVARPPLAARVRMVAGGT